MRLRKHMHTTTIILLSAAAWLTAQLGAQSGDVSQDERQAQDGRTNEEEEE